MLEVMFIMQHKQHTFKFKPTIDNSGIFVNIYTYKRDLRIAAHLLHVYSPIANALGNNFNPFILTGFILLYFSDKTFNSSIKKFLV